MHRMLVVYNAKEEYKYRNILEILDKRFVTAKIRICCGTISSEGMYIMKAGLINFSGWG